MSAIEEAAENSATADYFIEQADFKCEAGEALRQLLDLLVEANLHEEADESTDEALDKISRAETILLILSTRWAAAMERRAGR